MDLKLSLKEAFGIVLNVKKYVVVNSLKNYVKKAFSLVK